MRVPSLKNASSSKGSSKAKSGCPPPLTNEVQDANKLSSRGKFGQSVGWGFGFKLLGGGAVEIIEFEGYAASTPERSVGAVSWRANGGDTSGSPV